MKPILLALLLALAIPAWARDPAQVRAFRRDHPCPATGKTTGACPGYVVDHPWPLCAGGPDEPSNMRWQSIADSYRKDALERAACKRCPK